MDRSQIDVDSDSNIDYSDGSSDPEGGSKALDQKEELKTSSNIEKSVHTSPQDPPAPPHSQSQSPPITQPSIRRSTHANKGIPHIHADEDPKLELGSKNPVEKSQGSASVGEKDGKDGTLYLTVDAPQSYHEAMSHPDADEWVAAVSVEYQVLVQRGVFEEVEQPHEGHVHESRLVFSEKVGAEGEITRKKARLVAKGFTEVWGEDYLHTL